MDFNSVLQAISTIGFPIVMCLLLLYYMKTQAENHVEEVSQLREAINNNTNIMTKLLERIDTSNE